jgi:hypothetical protein
MADLTIPKGDYGYYINFTVQDSDGNAYDLTDYTIKWKVWAKGSPNNLLLNGSCSIVTAGSGTCRYAITSTDFNTKGLYNFELELTQSGIEESTRTYELEVTESG